MIPFFRHHAVRLLFSLPSLRCPLPVRPTCSVCPARPACPQIVSKPSTNEVAADQALPLRRRDAIPGGTHVVLVPFFQLLCFHCYTKFARRSANARQGGDNQSCHLLWVPLFLTATCDAELTESSVPLVSVYCDNEEEWR